MAFGKLQGNAFKDFLVMELLAIGEYIGAKPPEEPFERTNFNHVIALEFNIFLLVEFTVIQLDEPFILDRVGILNLEQRFHVEVPDLDQGIIERAEYVKDFITRRILSREETIPLKKSLVNIFRQVGDIKNKLLIINDYMFMLLNGKVLALFNIGAQHL